MTKFDFQTELNGPQLQAVTTIEGPVLIIAGAGSGKTRVITYRIAYMLSLGIPQSAILALTFTNKAAREMGERVKELTGKKLRNLTVSTFHAFGLKILRDGAELLGYRKNFSIYDETDRLSLIKESLRECRHSAEGVDLYALGQLFSRVKIGRLRWGAAGGRETADDVWEPVYKEYQHGLSVFNAMDFDDLLVKPIELFEQRPEIREAYRRRYRYIMVDEFQDTSLIQYRLMKLLASAEGPTADGPTADMPTADMPEADRPEGAANVCVVGDDDQSIYSWRGANYENLLLFEKDFPAAAEIKLEQNYRSTTTILEAANGVISNNANRKEKRLWSGNSGGKPIELFHPENESDEADFIADQIGSLRFSEKLGFSDFGVLVRTNSLTRNIEEAFLAAGIPYRVSGGSSFFQRKEIKDILSYLRLIANHDDDVNLLRIINTPRRGIGKTTVAALTDLARKNHSSIWNAMERARYAARGGQELLFDDKKGHGDLDVFMNQIEFFTQEILERKASGPGGWSLSQKVRALVDNINYWSYLVTEYSKNEKLARWKFANIEYFIKMIENWERDPDNLDPGLYPYLNRISLITRDDGEDEADRGKVNLMTIHASKGLEFPVVFIAGAEAGLIPHERSLAEDDGEGESSVEEERRLFYVAITRARDKLFITSCRKRRRLQSTADCAPSPFLAEIPPSLIEYHEEEQVMDGRSLANDFFAMIGVRRDEG
jgi:DNA helicase-2/ATP-dependent DNA helicase PcrA